MGQNGGRRPGAGRPRGPSKETIARALAVQKVEAQVRGDKRQLATDVLEKAMKICEGAAGAFQPTVDATGKPDTNDKNWPMFGEWVDRMVLCAKELAKYQSPTYKAIMTAPVAPDLNKTEERRRFTLRIFEGGKPAGVAELMPPEKKTG